MPDLARPAVTRRDPTAIAGTGRGTEPGRRPGLGSGRSLPDLLDRVVDRGVVVNGDVIIGLAGVDLIRLDLRLLLIGAQSAIEAGAGAGLRPCPAPSREEAADVIEGAVVHDDAEAAADDADAAADIDIDDARRDGGDRATDHAWRRPRARSGVRTGP